MNPFDNMAPLEDGFTGASNTDSDPDVADDGEWVRLYKDANRIATTHHDTKLKTSWSRNLRAFQNRHFQGSKYDTYRYRQRSKIFKTKTRSAVRKNIATAAAAMFSTEDVVSITAERPGDKLHATTARFLHAALNFRLDRTNKWAGPNWFLTFGGARMDTQLHGICVSKQYWEYEERTVPTLKTVTTPRLVLDATGLPITDLVTGEPLMEDIEEEVIEDEIEIARDRLMITLVPPEHAKIDPTGDWRDPIQDGGFLIVDFPMRIDDVEHILNSQADRNPMGGKAWRSDIDMKALQTARTERDAEASSVRRARGDGIDRYEQAFRGKDNNIVWLHECFYRRDGEDWHWWMIGDSILLSDPRPTIESYPALKGERPYVRGLGEVESHKTHPMAPVEIWQQAQIEINDITNLTLDAMKMGISPITKIRRGRGVDLKQVQNRGPDAAIMVQDLDDVTFDRAPDPSANGANYVNILSNDFDELAGVFSGSSVQSNRALNETVGGMRMLSNSANALTEYDLRVFTETWVEACLSQCVRLVAYYESDENVIAVAGEQAGLIENIVAGDEHGAGLDPKKEEADSEKENPFEPPIKLADVLGNLDKAMVTVKVNVGIGSLDPIQKMQRFMGITKMSMEFAQGLQEQGITLNASAFIQEGMGIAGWKDADRFFTKQPPKDEGPPPPVQLEMIKQKGKMAEKQLDAKKDMKIAEMTAANDAREIALKEMQFEFQKQMETLRVNQEQMAQRMSAQADDQRQMLDLLRTLRPQQAPRVQ